MALQRILGLTKRKFQATMRNQFISIFNDKPKICHFSNSKIIHWQTITTRTPNQTIKPFKLENIHPHKSFFILKHQNYSNQANTEMFHENQYHLIYSFPYIVHIHFLCKLKLYQTVFTVAAIPWALKMAANGMISTEMLNGVIGCSVLACVMLYVLSIYFQRLVGKMYINKQHNMVKVSHMTFWGKRNDIFMHPDSIIPLSDMSDDPNDIFVRLKQYDEKDEFYLVLRFGGVVDLELMKRLLGETKIK